MNNNLKSQIQNSQIFWLRKNLFNTWYNSLLTIICLAFIFWASRGIITWATTQAQWAVIRVNLRLFLVGRFPQTLYWRVWIVLAIASILTATNIGILFNKQNFTKLGIFIFAFIYSLLLIILPLDLTSRTWLLLIAFGLFAGFWLGKKFYQVITPWISLTWLLSFIVTLWLIGGGFGLQSVPTNLWNGLLLTLLMAVVSIILSFPIGVLLALGRTSNLPIIR